MNDRINLSMKEAAHRLGVSKAFLYLELSRGNLASLKFGKRRLLTVTDLEAYQAAHRHEAKAA
jgi:excisionase family DNA binding protein